MLVLLLLWRFRVPAACWRRGVFGGRRSDRRPRSLDAPVVLGRCDSVRILRRAIAHREAQGSSMRNGVLGVSPDGL